MHLKWYISVYFAQRGFKRIPVSIGHWCKNGWKTCWEYWTNKSLHKSLHKAWSFSKADFLLNRGKLNGPITYHMRRFIDVKDSAKSGWAVTTTGKNHFSKGRETIKSYGRYTFPDIAKAVSISLSRERYILKRILKVWKVSARWIHHLLCSQSDWWSRCCKFDLGPILSLSLITKHFLQPFFFGLFSVTSQSMCTEYWLTT